MRLQGLTVSQVAEQLPRAPARRPFQVSRERGPGATIAPADTLNIASTLQSLTMFGRGQEYMLYQVFVQICFMSIIATVVVFGMRWLIAQDKLDAGKSADQDFADLKKILPELTDPPPLVPEPLKQAIKAYVVGGLTTVRSRLQELQDGSFARNKPGMR